MAEARTAAIDPTPGLQSLQLKIGGMSCSFCVNAIERGLKRERGVEEVHVSLAHEEALVRFRPQATDEGRIKAALRSLGYLVRDPRKVGAFDEQLELKRKERNDLISAASFAILLFLAMAAMWLKLWQMQDWHAWTSWAIATYVFFWNGRRIIRMAWGAARRFITNQHVLLSVGAIGAYIGGVLGAPVPPLDWYGFVGFPPVDFFGVVVFLTTYHLLSGYISIIVRTRASESVRRLLEMQPPTARVVRGGEEREVAIEEVQVDDRVRVRPGERIPVDGMVDEGASAVDQSIVTGEPIPEDKGRGDEVIGGSVNQSGTLLVRVTRIGEDSFLRQVARHVEEAKAMKPGIMVLVDRVLLWYVPAVLGIAAAALLFWGLAPLAWAGEMRWVTAIYAAVTVLVMGYPCALGMATPLALIRGGGMAAERGILIRSGEAFQILKDITHVVFDKTGTITEGKPRVFAVDPLEGWSRTELLRVAASAEAPSEHPLARAVVVADRGMFGRNTLAQLRDHASAPFDYILGCPLRRERAVTKEVLARPGRYQQVADNLEVKRCGLASGVTWSAVTRSKPSRTPSTARRCWLSSVRRLRTTAPKPWSAIAATPASSRSPRAASAWTRRRSPARPGWMASSCSPPAPICRPPRSPRPTSRCGGSSAPSAR
jgi:cation transport ATPase